MSEKLSTHPPLPKRIKAIGSFMEAQPSASEKNSVKKVFAMTAVLFASVGLLSSGAVYAYKTIDVETFVGQLLENELLLSEEFPELIQSVVDEDLEGIALYIESGDDVNVQDIDGWTALHWAVNTQNPEVVTTLTEAGADPNVGDYFETTPLMVAAQLGNQELVEILLESGGDAHMVDVDGWSLLTYSVSGGNPELVSYLLDYGVDPGLKDNQGYTARVHAVKNGETEIARRLSSD